MRLSFTLQDRDAERFKAFAASQDQTLSAFLKEACLFYMRVKSGDAPALSLEQVRIRELAAQTARLTEAVDALGEICTQGFSEMRTASAALAAGQNQKGAYTHK